MGKKAKSCFKGVIDSNSTDNTTLLFSVSPLLGKVYSLEIENEIKNLISSGSCEKN